MKIILIDRNGFQKIMEADERIQHLGYCQAEMLRVDQDFQNMMEAPLAQRFFKREFRRISEARDKNGKSIIVFQEM